MLIWPLGNLITLTVTSNMIRKSSTQSETLTHHIFSEQRREKERTLFTAFRIPHFYFYSIRHLPLRLHHHLLRDQIRRTFPNPGWSRIAVERPFGPTLSIDFLPTPTGYTREGASVSVCALWRRRIGGRREHFTENCSLDKLHSPETHSSPKWS